MPTCPGCQQRLAHDRIPVHERHCPSLGKQKRPSESLEEIEHRLDLIERKVGMRIARVERLLEPLVEEQLSSQSTASKQRLRSNRPDTSL